MGQFLQKVSADVVDGRAVRFRRGLRAKKTTIPDHYDLYARLLPSVAWQGRHIR
jgi:hypothetical protein